MKKKCLGYKSWIKLPTGKKVYGFGVGGSLIKTQTKAKLQAKKKAMRFQKNLAVKVSYGSEKVYNKVKTKLKGGSK